MHITIPEVVRQLSTLPPERIAEVYDFVLFLKTRQSQAVDHGDEWSEDDMRDAASASLNYAEATLLAEEAADDSTG
jgi:hypothetical protein